MGKLDGKVVLVTGASRGIGKAIALLFAAEGAKVACVARSVNDGDHKFLEGSLAATVCEVHAAGGTAFAIKADLSREEECVQAVATAREVLGPVDVLINDAALSYFSPIKDTPTYRWDASWSVSVRAVFLLCKQVLPDMIQNGAGAIVNVSSGSAIGPGRGPYKARTAEHPITIYGAVKGAVERFTQGLAEEVYEQRISVTAVSPSNLVVTPATRFFNMADNPGEWNVGTEPPDMMARACLLLASEPIDKVTGRVTYSQAILKEFGWIAEAKGFGVDLPGSGYSQM